MGAQQGDSFFQFFYYFIFCIWVFCLYVCLCNTCMSGASRGQRRELDALELDLQVVVSNSVGIQLRTSESMTA